MLQSQGFDTSATVLALYSGTGFDQDLLTTAAARPDVMLVNPDRLYGRH